MIVSCRTLELTGAPQGERMRARGRVPWGEQLFGSAHFCLVLAPFLFVFSNMSILSFEAQFVEGIFTSRP